MPGGSARDDAPHAAEGHGVVESVLVEQVAVEKDQPRGRARPPDDVEERQEERLGDGGGEGRVSRREGTSGRDDRSLGAARRPSRGSGSLTLGFDLPCAPIAPVSADPMHVVAATRRGCAALSPPAAGNGSKRQPRDFSAQTALARPEFP